MAERKLGWILVHSHKQYPCGIYNTPQEELEDIYKTGLLWQWKRAAPLKEDGPYTLLLAWENSVFGMAECDVTHEVEDTQYNFSFRLRDYTRRQPVALTDLPIPENYRDLISLNQQMLDRYLELSEGSK